MRVWIDNQFGITEDIDGNQSFWRSDYEEINLEIFLRLFGEVETPPTYDDFISADPQNKSGWRDTFRKWQKEGIIEE